MTKHSILIVTLLTTAVLIGGCKSELDNKPTANKLINTFVFIILPPFPGKYFYCRYRQPVSHTCRVLTVKTPYSHNYIGIVSLLLSTITI